MQAVILAAGKGTRMGELTNACPKPMLVVLGKPLLAWKIESLPPSIDEVILVIGYLGEEIREYFGNHWQGRHIRYCVQEKSNGTGGATLLLAGIVTGKFLLTMGDDLYHPDDLSDLTQTGLAILGREVPKADDIGLIMLDDQGRFVGVREHVTQATPGFINTGAYLLDEQILAIPPVAVSATEYGLPQALAVLAETESVRVAQARDWQAITRPADLTLATTFLQRYCV